MHLQIPGAIPLIRLQLHSKHDWQHNTTDSVDTVLNLLHHSSLHSPAAINEQQQHAGTNGDLMTSPNPPLFEETN